MVDLTASDLDAEFTPKIIGTWNLHQATEGLELDFMALMSSISAVWGSNNLAHYSASNAFLDALALHRRSRGLAALSVNWGVLAPGGMSTNQHMKLSKTVGITPLSAEQITSALDALLGTDCGQKIVADMDWSVFKPMYSKITGSLLLDNITIPTPMGGAGSAAPAAASNFMLELAGCSADDRKHKIEEIVMKLACGGSGDDRSQRGLLRPGLRQPQDHRAAGQDREGAGMRALQHPHDYPNVSKLCLYLVKLIGDVAAAAPAATVTVARDVSSDSVAIIGMGLRMPGHATTPDQFWDVLVSGVDGVWRCLQPLVCGCVADLYSADRNAPGKMVFRRLGAIDDVDQFDADFFSISPREAQMMDPQQRLLLETAWEALEDGGVLPKSIEGSKTSVYVGIGTHDYSRLPDNTAPEDINAYFGSGNAHCVTSGRISYFLGAQGPSMAVDTACSSSLASAHLACESLLNGTSDLSLACGVNLILAADVSVGLSKASMLSPQGRCAAFDAGADGYVRGEGVGVLVLKRLSDAKADGDIIRAIICGSAINHDGHSSGLTVPNGPSQQSVMRMALAAANVASADLSFLECHGTATSLGGRPHRDQLGHGGLLQGPLCRQALDPRRGQVQHRPPGICCGHRRPHQDRFDARACTSPPTSISRR
jgi:myxalamid-type polyketide synthase MxaC